MVFLWRLLQLGGRQRRTTDRRLPRRLRYAAWGLTIPKFPPGFDRPRDRRRFRFLPFRPHAAPLLLEEGPFDARNPTGGALFLVEGHLHPLAEKA